MQNTPVYTMGIPFVVGHRGARGHAPENTLSAARLAQSQGAQMWELDVSYTKDRQLVVIHDDTLVRTTNVQKRFPGRDTYRVCDFTLEEVQTLDAGSWYLETDPFGCLATEEIPHSEAQNFVDLKVPTLAEALSLTKNLNWLVNVEIKDHSLLIGHKSVTEDVIACVCSLGMEPRVLLSSFQHTYLREAKKLLPSLPTAALVEDTRPKDPLQLCRELEVMAYHPGREIVTRDDVRVLRQAGFAVNVWTVNDMDEAKQLIADGVTGIITDFPAACLAALK